MANVFRFDQGRRRPHKPLGDLTFMTLTFEDRQLTVADSTWTLDRPILDAVQIDDRIIVVFDYMAYPQGGPANNLVAFDLSGNKLWVVAEQPIDHSTAAFTRIIAVDPLTVGNFAGFTCNVDPASGKLLQSQFTK